MENIEITSSYYKNRNLDKDFINSLYSLDISIENYFANMLFDNDLTRIIYASNEFSMRRRASQLDKSENPTFNNIYLPFMNYYLIGTSDPTTRPWFNFSNIVNGIFVEELGFNVKINPVKFQYESTLFYHTDYDTKFALIPLYKVNNTESKIEFRIQIKDQVLSCLGIAKYSITYNPTYKENDWLERNKIRSIALDFSIDTFLVEAEYDVSIPKEIIFDFLTTKKDMTDLNSEDWDLAQELITYYS